MNQEKFIKLRYLYTLQRANMKLFYFLVPRNVYNLNNARFDVYRDVNNMSWKNNNNETSKPIKSSVERDMRFHHTETTPWNSN